MAKTQHPSAAEESLLPSASPRPTSTPTLTRTHTSSSSRCGLHRLRPGCRCCGLGPLLASLVLLSLAGFLLWPADPDTTAASTSPSGTAARIFGRVTSGGGRVRARAVSYVDADLSLDGIRVVEDAIYLLVDLARGSVPFDTVAEVEGHVRFFFLSIPVKVSTNKTIVVVVFIVECRIYVRVEEEVGLARGSPPPAGSSGRLCPAGSMRQARVRGGLLAQPQRDIDRSAAS
ncbi:hypothetical protein GUJ93_ZPchr0013g35341 [Zizania palustris]|uniref:Late embryogenesis abundant protein LEA-2 subgroup domain-containing protein n=1 Tax=Zizania palustris TaxID=103762 RepID=A0A8J5WY37_ZIZPA|nr:hypothetical protein GUJ93_ZPchr0013g35341 [Zizania palustris]